MHSASQCTQRPGSGWELAGSTNTSIGVGHTGWLCTQRQSDPILKLGRVGFVLVQKDNISKSAIDKFIKPINSTLQHVAIVPQRSRLEGGCASFGTHWRLLEGFFVPHAPESKYLEIHLCAEMQQTNSSSSSDRLVKSIDMFRLSTAHRSSCMSSNNPGMELVRIPGFDIAEFWEDPYFLCIERGALTAGAHELHTGFTHQKQLRAWQMDQKDNVPEVDYIVADDLGNSSREHYFIIGPESSATRLWTHLVASGSGLTDEAFEDFRYDAQRAVFHLSSPWGDFCTPAGDPPIYNDFGGTSGAYEKLPASCTACDVPPHAIRFNVDPLSTVEHHRQRQNKVGVVLVVRDPRASLFGKMHDHCHYEAAGVKEQNTAFQLMLAATKANLPEVTTVCYEEMIAQGTDYIRQKLDAMGLASDIALPTITDSNSKYDLDTEESVATFCTSDMMAYKELCPDSELSAKVQRLCD